MTQKNVINEKIKEFTLEDLPNVMQNLKYFDGDIYFADDITSMHEVRQAFKTNFISFAFCLDGEASVRIDDRVFNITAHNFLLVSPNSVITVESYDNLKAIIFGVNNRLAFSLLNKTVFDSLVQLYKDPQMQFNDDEIEMLLRYYELAAFKIAHPQLSYGKETLEGLFRLFAYDLMASIQSHVKERATDSDVLRQSDRIFRSFMYMLADNKENYRQVKDFAEKLCVSPKYLTSICTKHSGKSAGELIQEAVVSRIRFQLLYTAKTIKEISLDMKFDNLSFFGKYVKKHLGTSPNNYRRQNGYGK